jgi:aldose 1-epimerase
VTAPTVVSLGAHPYFNLGGAAAGDVLDHVVKIAVRFPPARANRRTAPPRRSTAPLRARLRSLFRPRPALERRSGRRGAGYVTRRAAAFSSPETTQPRLQFYTGNKLTGAVVGRGGVAYRQSSGLALEPHGFPDAPHHPQFPPTVLRPGARYRATIGYRFRAA